MPGVSILEYSDTLSAVTEYLICPSARAAEEVIITDDKAAMINFFIFIFLTFPKLKCV
jgi:hypothetical protein